MECPSLSKARSKGTVFSLRFKELLWLKEAAGVSSRVTGRLSITFP